MEQLAAKQTVPFNLASRENLLKSQRNLSARRTERHHLSSHSSHHTGSVCEREEKIRKEEKKENKYSTPLLSLYGERRGLSSADRRSSRVFSFLLLFCCDVPTNKIASIPKRAPFVDTKKTEIQK